MPLAWASPEARGDLVDEVHGLLRLERPLPDLVLQRLPLDVLHGDVGPVLALADLVDDADVRVVQRRGRLGLDEEALLELGLVHEVRGEELQGHGSLELEVLGLVDDTHTAVADLLDDPVFPGNELVLRYDRERCRQGFRQGIGHPGICRERHPALPAEVRRVGVVKLTFRAFHDQLTLADARIVSPLERPVNYDHDLSFVPKLCPKYVRNIKTYLTESNSIEIRNAPRTAYFQRKSTIICALCFSAASYTL